MEHRWGGRLPIDVPVRLIVSSGVIGAGRIRNVSVTGAFLETDLHLPPLAIVHVESPAFALAHGHARRFSAFVVRHGLAGVGLEWCDLPDHALEDFLYAASSQGAQQPPRGQARGTRASITPPATARAAPRGFDGEAPGRHTAGPKDRAQQSLASDRR
jgi:hypothetical protein